MQKPKTFPATYTGGINAVTQSTTPPTHPAADRARPPRIRRPRSRAPARLMSLHSQSVTQAHKPGRCAEAKRHRSRGGHPGARPGGGGPGQGQPACTAAPRGLRRARMTRGARGATTCMTCGVQSGAAAGCGRRGGLTLGPGLRGWLTQARSVACVRRGGRVGGQACWPAGAGASPRSALRSLETGCRQVVR